MFNFFKSKKKGNVGEETNALKEKKSVFKQNGMSELEQSLLKGYIENYLNTIRPVFLLLPVVSDGFFKMTRAMIQKKGFDLEMPEDLGNKLMEFMNEDISVFISYLENNNIKLLGNEVLFHQLFMETLEEVNFKQCYAQYGDFLNGNEDLKEAVFKYIDVVGKYQDQHLDVGNISFFRKLLLQKRIIDEKVHNFVFIGEQIQNLEDQYDMDLKMRNLEERMQGNRVKFSVEDVDQLNGIEFEKLIADLFQRMGYTTELTKGSGDQGVDVLAYKGHEILAIQTKCYSGSVGNDAIQEVVAGMLFYNANKGLVVTNSHFTKSAMEIADSTGTLLWDRQKLSEMINLLY